MEFRNFTPFPALTYQAIDQHDHHYYVVAMRQTFALQASGQLILVDEQAPLLVADEYFGEMNRSSIKQESDLAPFKPKCDIIVVATAYAPGGVPTPSFPVRIRVLQRPSPSISPADPALSSGNVVLDKTLTVMGPRCWKKRFVLPGWVLTAPEPVTSLPLRYEYAYGGELRLEDEEGRKRAVQCGEDPEAVPLLRHTVVETNPVGRGYAEGWFVKAKKLTFIPAPQIENPQHPVQQFVAAYPAEGFGVITKVWLPRRPLCGTVDDAFAKSDKWLPDDFDFAYWNGAHPDLQVPYLQGNEIIELTNLTPDGNLCLELPGHRPFVLVRYEEGEMASAPFNLDTLFIDTDARQVALVHRLMLSTEPEVRVLEARLITRQNGDVALAARPNGAQNGRLQYAARTA